jgi:hypothetical protein
VAIYASAWGRQRGAGGTAAAPAPLQAGSPERRHACGRARQAAGGQARQAAHRSGCSAVVSMKSALKGPSTLLVMRHSTSCAGGRGGQRRGWQARAGAAPPGRPRQGTAAPGHSSASRRSASSAGSHLRVHIEVLAVALDVPDRVAGLGPAGRRRAGRVVAGQQRVAVVGGRCARCGGRGCRAACWLGPGDAWRRVPGPPAAQRAPGG